MPFHAEPVVLPPLYATGNLRVDVACADYWATPDRGLAVELDSVRVDALRTNGASGVAYTEDGGAYSVWSPTDVGYLVEPGVHHVRIHAPGCAPAELDVVAAADHAELASGRLATGAALAGPADAPNGFGLTLGAIAGPAALGPSSHTLGGFATAYAYDPNRSTGAWLGMSIERHAFAFSLDQTFAHGDVSGTALQTMDVGPITNPGPYHFAGDTYMHAMTVRLGARVALHDVALAAGSGIGFAWWFVSTKLTDAPKDTFADAPDTFDATWIVPVWASATIKPSCNWGVQLLARYDVHPTALDANGLALGAGWIYQPAAACSDAPGIRVAPI